MALPLGKILMVDLALIMLTCAGCGNKTSVAPTISEAETPVVEVEVEPKSYVGDIDFEKWRTDNTAYVIDAVANGMNKKMDADQLVLYPGLGLIRMHDSTNIEEGDTIDAQVWLWAEQPETLTFTLVRACSNSNPEVLTETLQLSTHPQKFKVSKSFEDSHSCFWTRLRGTREDQKVYAWGYQAFKNGMLISGP